MFHIKLKKKQIHQLFMYFPDESIDLEHRQYIFKFPGKRSNKSSTALSLHQKKHVYEEETLEQN